MQGNAHTHDNNLAKADKECEHYQRDQNSGAGDSSTCRRVILRRKCDEDGKHRDRINDDPYHQKVVEEVPEPPHASCRPERLTEFVYWRVNPGYLHVSSAGCCYI